MTNGVSAADIKRAIEETQPVHIADVPTKNRGMASESLTANSTALKDTSRLKSRISRDDSGMLQTEQGTLYVSKPYRSEMTKRLRAIVTFTPRTSHFDLSNTASGQDEFRGFFTLFWISLFILTVRTYVISFEQTGQPLSLGFASMFSRDAATLALSDAVLVGNTFICVPFAKALRNGWMRYNYAITSLQYLYQATLLVIAITWTFNRQWPWVQSGFLTLHTIVMIMKVHSYLTHNGNLSVIAEEAVRVERGLREAADRVGGWNQALKDAENSRSGSENTTAKPTPVDTPALIPEGVSKSYINGPTANDLQHRLIAATGSFPHRHNANAHIESSLGPTESPLHLLVSHPVKEISILARVLIDLQSELTSTGKEKVRWPSNVTWANYVDYLIVPSLVYELEFPRTDRIRPMYVLEKTVATFGTFTLLYTIAAQVIIPLTPTPDQSFLRSLLDLSLPFMLSYLLLFYLIFECICNGFAELSRFADRQFYEDWWNATSQDEFARKWNKPISKGWATFWTFLLSAAMHELVMAIVTKKLRMYLFVMQMCQVPLIALGRLPAIKKNKILGNIVFWLGLYAGFPLLCVAYCAY